jgi:hypothetical protein
MNLSVDVRQDGLAQRYRRFIGPIAPAIVFRAEPLQKGAAFPGLEPRGKLTRHEESLGPLSQRPGNVDRAFPKAIPDVVQSIVIDDDGPRHVISAVFSRPFEKIAVACRNLPHLMRRVHHSTHARELRGAQAGRGFQLCEVVLFENSSGQKKRPGGVGLGHE